MTEQDKKYWNSLYEYVKNDILQYGSDKALSTYCVYRLKSMQYGKFMYKSKNKNNGKIIYPFIAILYTFKIKKNVILSYFDRTEFTDERHKINGMMSIISNSINDVIDMVKKQSQQKKELKNLNITNKQNSSKAAYKKRTKEINKTMEDLW